MFFWEHISIHKCSLKCLLFCLFRMLDYHLIKIRGYMFSRTTTPPPPNQFEAGKKNDFYDILFTNI